MAALHSASREGMPISNEAIDGAFDLRQSRQTGRIKKKNDVDNLASSESQIAAGGRTHVPSLYPICAGDFLQEGPSVSIISVHGDSRSENNLGDTSKDGGEHSYAVDVKMLPVSAASGNSEVEGPVSKSVGTHAFKTSHVSEVHQHAKLARNIKSKEQSVHKKPHACNECGLVFSYESALMTHLLTHTNECNTCGQRFAHKDSLTTHMRIHAKEKHHVCGECGQRFSRKYTLSRHMLTHTHERPHMCNECGQSFALKSTLTAHMLTHTHEKPHECNKCGKRFAQKSSLTTHILTHTNEKRHICSECGQRFLWTSTLNRHVVTHTNEKPHVCSECGRRFSQ